MTKEQKDKLEQLADKFAPIANECYEGNAGFKAGAQTILDNPGEWGLQDIEDSDERWCEVVDHFKQEADHYRRALERLERLTSDNPDYEFINLIAKEALKQ